MNQEFIQILKPVINKTLKKFISLIDTSKIKDRRLKDKALKNIGHLTNESVKIILAVIEYSTSIIEKNKEDAIKDIQKNKYGGPFTLSQATKIYNSLKKSIDIFTKSLKKSNKKKNISELKKLVGGSNIQLIDRNGDFTTEMDNILSLSGGADEDGSSGGPGPGTGPRPPRVSIAPQMGEYEASTAGLPPPVGPPLDQPLDITGETTVSALVAGFATILTTAVGYLNPYLNYNESRQKKIHGTKPFIGVPNFQDTATPNEGDLAGMPGLIARLKRQVNQLIYAPSADFPSEYGKTGTILNKLAGVIGVCILLALLFSPALPIIQVINPVMLISALLTKRRLLVVITIINFLTSIVLGPFSAIFIQGPLYLFYFMDGQKYLRIYQNQMKDKPNVRQVTVKELLGNYTIKKSSRGAVVGRFKDEISAKNNEIKALTEKIAKGSGDEDDISHLEKLKAHLKIEKAKKKIADEGDYTKLSDRHLDLVDAISAATDAGHTDDTHAKLLQNHIKKIEDIDRYNSISVDGTNSYFNQLYTLYQLFRRAMRVLSGQHQLLPAAAADRDLDSFEFKRTILAPYINKTTLQDTAKTPFKVGTGVVPSIPLWWKGRGGADLKTNIESIQEEAGKLMTTLKKEDDMAVPFWWSIDYIQEGYLASITDDDLSAYPIDIVAREAIMAAGGTGGSVAPITSSKKELSILDLYRSPISL